MAVPDEAFLVLHNWSKNLSLERSKDRVITARCLVDLRLIDTKSGTPLSTPSVYLMSLWLNLSGLSPKILHNPNDQRLEGEQPGNKATKLAQRKVTELDLY